MVIYSLRPINWQLPTCLNEDYDCSKQAEQEEGSTPTRRLKLPGEMAPLKVDFKRTFSGGFLAGGILSPRAASLPKSAILKRLNSRNKDGEASFQLGHQISLKWSTGAGARIGCIADYPSEVREQALEIVHLSPRPSSSSAYPSLSAIAC